jgi:hypothetical protein
MLNFAHSVGNQVVHKRFHAYRPDIDASKKQLLTLQALHVLEKQNWKQIAEPNIPGVHCRAQLPSPLGKNAPPPCMSGSAILPLFVFLEHGGRCRNVLPSRTLVR